MRKLDSRTIRVSGCFAGRSYRSALVLRKIRSGAIFSPPRTVEHLIAKYPDFVPAQVRYTVRSRQGGRLRCSDQLEDLIQEVYLHLSRPAVKTGLTPLANFNLGRMDRTPEHGWRAHMYKVITNHVINILRQPGPQRLQYALGIEVSPDKSPDTAFTVRYQDLPNHHETPEDTFLIAERLRISKERIEKFKVFVYQHMECDATISGLEALAMGESRADIVQELGLKEGDYRKLCDNLRVLWQVFMEKEWSSVVTCSPEP